MMRPLAAAALTGCTAALVADVLLHLTIAAIRLDGGGWTWVAPTVLERGRWVVTAGLLWLIAPLAALEAWDRWSMPRASAWASVGRLMLVVPLSWATATVFLRAVRLTVEGGWSYEGRIFLTSEFYGSLILAYAPWVLGGLLLIALSRHLDLQQPVP